MKTVEWGYLIVLYLFLGGLSAGLFFVSALATLSQKDGAPSRPNTSRVGAFLAPLPVAIGCSLLIFDLGNWYRFYKLFLHFRWTSPMSIGSWLLALFTLLSFAHAYAWIEPQHRESVRQLLKRWPRLASLPDLDISHWRRVLAVAGLPLSIGVGIYTGVLLGAVQSRPFWNTNLVAQLFLVSALSTGCAALMLALVLKRVPAAELRSLYVLDLCLMTLEVFIVAPYIIHGQLSVQAVQDSLQLILGGPYTLLFWVAFAGLGLAVPLAIELLETLPSLVNRSDSHVSTTLTIGAASLVLLGGFVLRYVFVFAGQMSAFR